MMWLEINLIITFTLSVFLIGFGIGTLVNVWNNLRFFKAYDAMIDRLTAMVRRSIELQDKDDEPWK